MIICTSTCLQESRKSLYFNMPLEVKRQERETSQNLARRFSRRMKQSGLLRRARKNRFKSRPKSQQMKKRSALRREELRKEYEKEQKMGKAKERR